MGQCEAYQEDKAGRSAGAGDVRNHEENCTQSEGAGCNRHHWRLALGVNLAKHCGQGAVTSHREGHARCGQEIGLECRESREHCRDDHEPKSRCAKETLGGNGDDGFGIGLGHRDNRLARADADRTHQEQQGNVNAEAAS